MSDQRGTDTSRTRVQTYVPAYQREEWDEHAEELEMSRSEFVRSMVQAGRSKFDPDVEPNRENEKEQSSTARGDLETQVLEALELSGPLSWDALLSDVTDDVEQRLEETLNELQAANKVQYSGRAEGYVLLGESDE